MCSSVSIQQQRYLKKCVYGHQWWSTPPGRICMCVRCCAIVQEVTLDEARQALQKNYLRNNKIINLEEYLTAAAAAAPTTP